MTKKVAGVSDQFLLCMFDGPLLNKPTQSCTLFHSNPYTVQISRWIAAANYCLTVKNRIAAHIIFCFEGFSIAAVITLRHRKSISGRTTFLLWSLNADWPSVFVYKRAVSHFHIASNRKLFVYKGYHTSVGSNTFKTR